MKLPALFLLCYLLPYWVQAQKRKGVQELSRWYVGIDALLREETVQASANFAPIGNIPDGADLGPGFTLGYRPNYWLTLETGAYRLRYIHRLRVISGDILIPTSLFGSSPDGTWTSWGIPLRAYVDPFAFSQSRPRRVQVQLMGGVGYASFHRHISRAVTFESSRPTANFASASDRIVNGHMPYLEGALHLRYRLTSDLALSLSYGRMIGLTTVHEVRITGRPEGIEPAREVLQTSNGTGPMLRLGLKYEFGPPVLRPDR